MDVEKLARELHEAGRAAVEAGQTVAHGKFGEKARKFIEWGDLDEAAREGRRVQARYLLGRYDVTPRAVHLIAVVDRSGSMAGIRDDVVGGWNSLLEAEAQANPATRVTFIQFDTENPYEVVYADRPVAEAPRLDRKTYRPRGGTPLLDAVGRTLSERLDREEGSVLLVIITDGQENSSLEFKKPRVKELLEKAQAKGWGVSFIGANFDAFAEAHSLGLSAAATVQYASTEALGQALGADLTRALASYRATGTVKMRDD